MDNDKGSVVVAPCNNQVIGGLATDPHPVHMATVNAGSYLVQFTLSQSYIQSIAYVVITVNTLKLIAKNYTRAEYKLKSSLDV